MKIIRIIRKPEDIVIPKGTNRPVVYAVAHCTAGPQNQTTEEIFNFWKKNNGWTNVGYHFDINADGTIEQLCELSDIANGVAGHNAKSIHFCYKGGIDKNGKPVDNRTEAQKKSQLLIVKRLKQLYPNIIFLGHRDFSLDKNGNGIIESWEWIKSCPSLDFRNWLSSVFMDKVVEPDHIVYKLNNPLIKNDTVRAIQTALKINVDGAFGARTDMAVKSFQSRLGLNPDGIIGEKTASNLEALIPKNSLYKGLLSLIKNNQ